MSYLSLLPPAERPRERLEQHGAERLSTPELLAILLGHGTKKQSVLELASALLVRFGTLEQLASAPIADLTELPGIGPAQAVRLKAAFELSRRLQEGGERPFICEGAESLYTLFSPHLALLPVETLAVALFDAKRRLLHWEVVAQGTLTAVATHPREVYAPALHHRAHSIALAHNHPSGDPTPSSADYEVTSRLSGAGRLLNIPLLDHLVIGRGRYCSLRSFAPQLFVS